MDRILTESTLFILIPAREATISIIINIFGSSGRVDGPLLETHSLLTCIIFIPDMDICDEYVVRTYVANRRLYTTIVPTKVDGGAV